MDNRKGSGPKTVIRGLGFGGPAEPPVDPLPRLAQPLIELARRAGSDGRPDARRLANDVRDAVATFEREARRAGLPDTTVLDARDALAVLVDVRARNNPALPTSAWTRALAAVLPLGPEATPEAVRKHAADAAAGGSAKRDLARFLTHCSQAIDDAIATGERRRPVRGASWAALVVGLFVVGLAGWAAYAEWRYREKVVADLPDVATVIANGLTASAAVRATQLDAMETSVVQAEKAAAGSPLGLLNRIGPIDPALVARDNYVAASAALVADPLRDALDVSLSTEGEPGALYDTLRAWSILTGRSAWQPRFIEGWVRERAETFPDLVRLAPHISALSGPLTALAPPDPEALGQAREIAAEGTVTERATIELRRSAGAAALSPWLIETAVPGLAAVVVRRSGVPLSEGIDGIYTEAGWQYARDGGAEAAIDVADSEAAVLLGRGGKTEKDAVLDDLQRRTLKIWSEWLGDLRVEPFSDQPEAVLISGALALRNSPMSALIREVWRQVGGEDRTRSHANQLKVAAEFGPAIQFVEQGRMAEISQLFASLNVTLASLGRTSEVGSQKLLDVQGRAASIVALQQAPTLVVQIVEDVLAQSAAPVPTPTSTSTTIATGSGSAGSTPTGAVVAAGPDPIWNNDVVAVCHAAIDGRYPFTEGPDADLSTLAAAFGPSGRIRRYFTERAAELMDMTGPEWRWKPEARLSGRSPESALFLQRVAIIGDGLFGQDMAPAIPLRLEALAQRGAATVTIGGLPAPVVVNGAAMDIYWPGPDPSKGFQIAFEGNGAPQRKAFEGVFGFQRALDGLRLRPRDDGRRFLIDVRLDPSRVYFQMSFNDTANPVSVRALMRGLTCPSAP